MADNAKPPDTTPEPPLRPSPLPPSSPGQPIKKSNDKPAKPLVPKSPR